MAELKRPIREILRKKGNLFKPSNAQKGYRYARVFSGGNGYEIAEAKMLGYQVVQGDMPEDKERRNADGVAELADTVLMRIKEEEWNDIRDYKAALDKRQSGLSSEEEERLYHMRAKGVRIFNFRDNDQLKRIVNKEEGI